jgi:hypothetical protein
LIDHPLTEELFITSATLSTYLNSAEYSQSKAKLGIGVRDAVESGIKKRRRESTPPEQLDEDDERKFQAEEEEAEDRAEHDDSSYYDIEAGDETDQWLHPRLRGPG